MGLYLDLPNGQNSGPNTAHRLYFEILGHYFGLQVGKKSFGSQDRGIEQGPGPEGNQFDIFMQERWPGRSM